MQGQGFFGPSLFLLDFYSLLDLNFSIIANRVKPLALSAFYRPFVLYAFQELGRDGKV